MESRGETVDGRMIQWSSSTLNLDSVISSHKLPVIIKVTEGFMLDENLCLDAEQVLKIHGVRRHLRGIKAVDCEGAEIKVPTRDNTKVKLVPASDITFKTVRDICLAKNLPLFIENQLDFVEYGQKFSAGTVFQVIKVNNDNQLSVIVMGEKKIRLLLLASVRGHFKEVLDAEDRDKEFFLEDLADRRFPLWVEFLSASKEEDDTDTAPKGVVGIREIIIEETIHSFSYIDDEKHAVEFPKKLAKAVMLTIGTVVAKEEPIYEKMHEPTREGPLLITTEDKGYGGKVPQWGTPLPVPGARNVYNIDTFTDYSHIYAIPSFNTCTSLTPSKTIAHNPPSTYHGRKLPGMQIFPPISPVTETRNMRRGIGKCSGEEICEMLRRLQLEKCTDEFRKMQVDGHFLLHISEENMVTDFNLTRFQARKLQQYIRGWIPDAEKSKKVSEVDNDEDLEHNSSMWTEEEVSKRLQEINLFSLESFCRKNQVNGALLKEIIGKEVLDSVRADHSVTLSGSEEKKLYIYIKEGWRPPKM